jgi:polysaccharide chain length determinant protein (PEP-CTERM system associated)
VIRGKQYRFEDFIAIAIRRRWLLIVPFVLVTAGTWLAVRRLPDRYKAETVILVVPQRVPESYVRSTVTARVEDRLPSISQQILSRTRLERIIQDMDLYAKDRPVKLMEDIVAHMRKDIDVEIVKGDSFRVAYTGDEPRTVMQVTQRLASLFIDENLRDRAVLVEETDDFLESQLAEARARLLEHEKKLEQYRRQYSGQLPNQASWNLQLIQNSQMQIQALNESMARDRERRLILERQIADLNSPDATVSPSTPSGSPSTTVGSAQQQLDDARQQLVEMQTRLKPEHPDVGRLKRAIARLEQAAAAEAAGAPQPGRTPNPQAVARQNRLRELNTELSDLTRQLAAKESDARRLADVIAQHQTRLEAVPTRESELVDLTRDYDTLQQTYRSLLAKKQDSKLATNLERRQIGEQFKVLDPAGLPEKPASPNRMRLNLVGAFSGLAIGILLVGFLEYIDSTFKSDDEIVAALSLPVLALVPVIESAAERIARVRRTRLIVGAASVGVVGSIVAALLLSMP